MKKVKIFLTAVVAIAVAMFAKPTQAEAQSTKLVTKSITTADTVVFTSVPSKIKTFSYTYLESSGTTAGKVYFEGSTISGAWDTIDSLVLSDVATLQKKTFAITSTNYLSYRLRNTNTSSATGAIKAAYLRRTDE